MAEFPEHIKKDTKQRSAYKCCLCHVRQGTHVHHIYPPEERGNVIENAAPLCAGCHDLYGHDPSKRKHVEWARDSWWKWVEDNYTPLMREEMRKIAEEVTDEKLGPVKEGLRKVFAYMIGRTTVDSMASLTSGLFATAIGTSEGSAGPAGTIATDKMSDLDGLGIVFPTEDDK